MTSLPLRSSKGPRHVGRGILLFAVCTIITTVGWASSGHQVDYPASQQDSLRPPKIPADMEDRIQAAVNAPPLTVGQLTDPFVSDEKPSDGGGSVPRVIKPQVPSFAERYEAWRRAVWLARQEGKADPPVTTVYLAEELLPIGVVRAHGQTEVLFHIAAEKRDIAATVGTHFHDCVLTAIEDSGVRITSGDHFRILEWASASGPADLSASSPQPAKKPAGATDPMEMLREAAPDPSTRPRSVAPGAKQPPNSSLAPAVPAVQVVFSKPVSLFASSSPRLAPTYATYFRATGTAEAVRTVPVSDHSDTAAHPSKKKDAATAPDAQPTPVPEGSRPRQVSPTDSKDDTRVKQDDHSGTGFPGPAIPESDSPKVRADRFCNSSYEGPPASIDTTRPTSLVTLTELYYRNFGVNFLVDPDVQELPIRASINDAPWTAILRQIIEVN
ncbi:MAG: hypothetical protein ACREAC_27205, partial [Blastocatellia bacterium]